MGEFWSGGYAYFATALLVVIGLYAILMKRNLVKKLIGLNILQAAIIIAWVATASRPDATVPVLDPQRNGTGHLPEAAAYLNPLPHTLMLTAIVVGVATTGVALALLISIYRRFGTEDEAELLRQMRDAEG